MSFPRSVFARTATAMRWTAALFFLCVGAALNICAQNVVYAATNQAGFGTLDLDHGTYTQLGVSPKQLAGVGEFGANLYGAVLGGSDLQQINLANGSLTDLGGFARTLEGSGATTASPYLLDSNGYLYSVNFFGGAHIVTLGLSGLIGGTLAMSSDGALLYATQDSGTGSVLYSLNTSTGAATYIGPTGVGGITSLVFRHGTLYAAANDTNIYTLNIANGQATFHVATSPPTVAVGMAIPASTLTVLHTFTGHDGATPEAGLIADRTGNLYGTTYAGGTGNVGTVYKMTKRGQNYTFGSLYSFQDGSDGAYPEAPLVIGPNGALYGTTYLGGNGNNEGTLFEIRPPAAFCRSINCQWGKSTLHIFQNGNGCAGPAYGGLIFDSSGNMYGTGVSGGLYGQGCAYKMTPSGGSWTFSDIYDFGAYSGDGKQPYCGVTFDNAGNLYGTTRNGGSDSLGTAYQLTPSGGTWEDSILHSFAGYPNDGQNPVSGLLFDGSSHLYGGTSEGGTWDDGAVYDLTRSGNSWNYSLLYSLPQTGIDYSGPWGAFIMDAAGNLYGTTNDGGQGAGSVFELTPSNGSWIYSLLYSFADQADGARPFGSLLLDSAGNLYGTTSCSAACPQGNYGTVYVLTPE